MKIRIGLLTKSPHCNSEILRVMEIQSAMTLSDRQWTIVLQDYRKMRVWNH